MAGKQSRSKTARTTSGARASAGAPRAMSLPLSRTATRSANGCTRLRSCSTATTVMPRVLRQIQHVGACPGIEVVGRFVEQEHPRLLGYGPGDGRALALATRKPFELAVTEGRQPGLLERRVDDAAIDLRGCEPGMGKAAQSDIVGHGQAPDPAHRSAPRRRCAGARSAKDRRRRSVPPTFTVPVVGGDTARQKAQQRRLGRHRWDPPTARRSTDAMSNDTSSRMAVFDAVQTVTASSRNPVGPCGSLDRALRNRGSVQEPRAPETRSEPPFACSFRRGSDIHDHHPRYGSTGSG